MQARSRHAARFAAALAILALLSGCGVRNPFERKTTMTRWTEAVGRGDFGAAEQLIVAEDGPRWRAGVEQLTAQHGLIQAIQSGDITPAQGPPLRSIRVTWADGHERCLQAALPIDARIDILGSGWQDCAAVPFNPTPEPYRPR